MHDVEIARVQLRKADQQIDDLRERLRTELDGLLSEAMQEGLCACVREQTWLIGHGYRLDDSAAGGDDLQGAVLTSDDPAHPRVLVRFVARTRLPPYGGFAADLFIETSDEWKPLVGLAGWQPEELEELPELFSDFADES